MGTTEIGHNVNIMTTDIRELTKEGLVELALRLKERLARSEAEKERQRLEIERLKLIETSLMNATYGVTISLDNEIVWANNTESLITGYTRDELQGMNLSQFAAHQIDPENLGVPSSLDRGLTRIAINQTKTGEKYLVRIATEIIRNREEVPIGKVSITEKMDIDAENVQEAFVKMEEYKMIVEKTNDLIISTDVKGDIKYMNPAALNAFGYEDLREVIGMNISSFYIDAAESKRVADLMQKKIKENDFSPIEVRNRKRNGELMICLVSANRVFDKDKNLHGNMGISRDITQLKEHEEALKEAEDELRIALSNLQESHKDAVTKFADLRQNIEGRAHDVKNILKRVPGFAEHIKGFLDTLLSQCKDNEKEVKISVDPEKLQLAYSNSEAVHRIGTTAVNTFEGILENVRKKEGIKLQISHLGEFDLDMMLKEIEADYDPEMGLHDRDLRVSINLPEDVLFEADFAELREVVKILVDNADKFSHNVAQEASGGEKRIPVDIDVYYNEQTAEIIIEVRDYGEGITENKMETLFDVKDVGGSTEGVRGEKGTGIGLSNAREMIEDKLGGRIYATSQLGKGSSFFIAFKAMKDNRE